LHLGASSFSPEFDNAVQAFLDGDDQRLFINASSENDGAVVVPIVSTNEPSSGGLVFYKTESGLQCAFLHVQALQHYTHSFMPLVENESIVEKLKQLQVALQQSGRRGRIPHVELALVEKQVEDEDAYLNELQSCVSDWIVQIRKLTSLVETPFVTNIEHAAAEEVAFWTNLHAELIHLQDQLKEPVVLEILNKLREAKRFVATVALENCGLDHAVVITTDVVQFLKPYDLEALQATRSLDQIVICMNSIFDQIAKVRSSRYYGLERACQLLEATTSVLRDAVVSVLPSNIIFMDYKDYESKVRFPALDVFVQFDDRLQEFKDFMLEQGRKRKTSMSKSLDNMVLHHKPLQQRLDMIHDFRSAQETLCTVVHTVLREEEPEVIQAVELAPRQIFSGLDVLDLSSGRSLDVALEEYDLQMDALEERLARLLRDKLTACQVSMIWSCKHFKIII
jgi:dynein heavy chain 1